MSSVEIPAQSGADGKDDAAGDLNGLPISNAGAITMRMARMTMQSSPGKSEDEQRIALHMQHFTERVNASNAFLAQQLEDLQQHFKTESARRQAEINKLKTRLDGVKSEAQQIAHGKCSRGLTMEERFSVIEERLGIGEALRRAENEQALGERRAAAADIAALRGEVEELRRTMIDGSPRRAGVEQALGERRAGATELEVLRGEVEELRKKMRAALPQSWPAEIRLPRSENLEPVGTMFSGTDTKLKDEGARQLETGDASSNIKLLCEQLYAQRLAKTKDELTNLSNDIAVQAQNLRDFNSTVHSLHKSAAGHYAKYDALATKMKSNCDATLARLNDEYAEEGGTSLGDLATVLKPDVLRRILFLTPDEPSEITTKSQSSGGTSPDSLSFELSQTTLQKPTTELAVEPLTSPEQTSDHLLAMSPASSQS